MAKGGEREARTYVAQTEVESYRLPPSLVTSLGPRQVLAVSSRETLAGWGQVQETQSRQ